MAFSFLKKKKEPRMDLPPPPPSEQLEFPEMPKEEEIPAVSGKEVAPEPEMPPPPPTEEAVEEAPIEELPEELPPEMPTPVEVAPKVPEEAPPEEMIPIPEAPLPEEEAPIPELPPITRKRDMILDKTVQPEIEETPEEIVPIAPLFVSMQDYKEIINGINTTKDSLEEAEVIVARLNDLKIAQERIFEDWKNQLEDIERKISYVDEIVAQGE